MRNGRNFQLLTIAGSLIERPVSTDIGGVGFDQELTPEPRVVRVMVRIHRIVDKDQFRLGLRFIFQTVSEAQETKEKRNAMSHEG